ncbi:MAG: hypothetical protein ACHQQQ_07860 [Bacteroidota bacterium]
MNSKIHFLLTILFLSIAFGFLILSCHHSNEPPQPPTPGKRNYTWTVDTLSYPGSFQTDMVDIWASSTNDIYVVGHNSTNRGQMYHFDGVKWSPIHLAQSDGGYITGIFDLMAIYGLNSRDIYAVGYNVFPNQTPPPNFFDSSLIIHFDGTSWKKADITNGGILNTIWGSNSNDIWAGGYNGTLFHYRGGRWAQYPFDTTNIIKSIYGFGPSDIYATSQKIIDVVPPEDTIQFFLYHYNGATWIPADSFMITPDHMEWKFGLNLWCTDKLYSSTYGVYMRDGSTWKQLLRNDLPLRAQGSSNENIFAVGDGGYLFHWNGTDWKELKEIEDPQKIFWGSWTNNIETFMVSNDGRMTYILHGK